MDRYLSVTEYAKLNGKDPGNIRRLLSSGRMKGQKVGRQWIIEEGTVYPEDRREKSGVYHNWRKRGTIMKENRNLMTTLSRMISSLSSIYGSTMYEVILYGSYARGTETDESDVDIAVILLSEPDRKTTDMMVDSVAAYELECGKVLSVIDVNYDRFNRLKNVLPFYRNILREGIVLWKMKA